MTDNIPYSELFGWPHNYIKLFGSQYYNNCSCIKYDNNGESWMAQQGKCESDCSWLPVFMPLFTVVMFGIFITSMPALAASLRWPQNCCYFCVYLCAHMLVFNILSYYFCVPVYNTVYVCVCYVTIYVCFLSVYVFIYVFVFVFVYATV